MKPCHLSAAIAVVSAGILSCGGSSGPSNNFAATLNGANEAPTPVTTAATGTCTLTLSGTTVNYTLSATGLSASVTGGHIHVILQNNVGPVVVNFLAITPAPAGATAFSVNGSFTAANIAPNTGLNPPVVTLDDLIAAIRAGNAYANIHTTGPNAGGEIRGKLVVQ